MAHQSQLENKKYRNWVKAGLGLKYTKEGLEPSCDQLVKQQHVNILNKVQHKRNLASVSCGLCDIRILQPDHVRTRSRQCPLGQVSCNCQHPGGKIICPNSVCGAIYDEIIQLHASTPPSPYWKNTDAKQWCTEPWAVAKCFINAAGYEKKLKASEVDCSGLIHVLSNNMDFRGHLKCTTDGSDLLQKVNQYRNIIYHSHDMELEDNDVTTYIDDMIAVLQDGKELIDMAESKCAVDKLRELKGEDFVITTTNEADIRRGVMADINRITEEAEKREYELEQKGKEVSAHVASIGTKQKTEIEQKKTEISGHVENIETKLKTDLEQKGKEVSDQVAITGTKHKTDLEQKGKEVSNQIESIGTKQKTSIEQKGNEISALLANTGTKQKTDLEQRGTEVRDQLEATRAQQNVNLEQKGKEISDEVRSVGMKQTINLEQRGKEISDQIASLRNTISKETTKINTELELKQKKSMEELVEKKTKLTIELEQNVKRDPEEDSGLRQQDQDYDKRKTKYQRKLVNDYERYSMHVSSLPLQPEHNQTDIENVCVPPWMTEDIWDEKSGQTKEVGVSVDKIFHNVEKPARNIYVLGEAGSGKTTLCKMLMYYWCVAHSEREVKTIESDIVKVMENYDFLFYVSLRHYSDLYKIENMLDLIYPDSILSTILQNESDKCLILLDGLDEWAPQNQRPSQFLTPGLPTRDLHANYTIITTTRRWKFDTLRVKNNEKDKEITLKGIRGNAVTELTKTTMKTLNETFHKNKAAADFLPALQRSPVADVSHVPMILQQLICLWFDDKLRGTSKCAIYSSMLDLFFDWNALKLLGKQEVLFQLESRLPEYLSKYNACYHNKRVICHLSHLAYTTLLDRNKEHTLTFSSSVFKQLNIPDDVKTGSLKLGILSEDQNINLFASRRKHTSFAFVHKSIQEFLAAVYVAIQFETMILSLDDLQNGSEFCSENCKQFVRNHFGDCKNVADILERSNMFVMLCGLEPLLLPYISEYIHNITTIDGRLIQERKIAKDNYRHKNMLKTDIQNCIVCCASEALSRGNQYKNSVYIADIVLAPTTDIGSYLQRQIFNLHSVLSIETCCIDLSFDSSNKHMENLHSFLKLLSGCDSLKTIKYDGYKGVSATLSLALRKSTERMEQHTVEIIARNKFTLETVSLVYASEQMVSNLVQIMPSMSHLISFRASNVTVSHELCRSLCTILEQSVHLQQIWLDIGCNKYDEHSLNLSEHNQLQYLNLRLGRIYSSSANTENLNTCKLHSSNLKMMKQECASLYNARKLKHLLLDQVDGVYSSRYNPEDFRYETDCLVRLLSSLTNLSTVELSKFTFTDNIITRPFDMKNLQEITLRHVTMDMATWCSFVDSLPTLPQTVHVTTRLLTVCDTGFMISDKAARQYVRRKTESFSVTNDAYTSFIFVTKKQNC